ncbi:MAG: TIGR00341 family protein [Lachnospiraceae bacterium]
MQISNKSGEDIMKEQMKEAFSIRRDTADFEEIRERIVSGGMVTGTNLCILMLAILIASIGLNMNSTAVIIGAMLISPLMGSIQAIAYGAASSDAKLLKNSAVGLVFQVVICLVTSTLYFWISPISTKTSELLARTQPNIWDVIIAVCGGLAGMIGLTRKEKSNVLPGVAIATALMPPLCTCGYGIAHGNLRILLGAGYLFLVNTYFIFLSSALVLVALEVPREKEVDIQKWKRVRKRLILNTVIMLIPSIIVAGNMVRQANKDAQTVTGFEKAVPVEQLISEIYILFPTVSNVKLGTMESVDEAGELVSETSAVIYLREKMGQEESMRFEKWLETVYGEKCEIVYIIEE